MASLAYQEEKKPDAPPRESERIALLKEFNALKSERESWIAHWQDLNDYVLPRRLRYLQVDRNKGTKRNDKIINNRATKSARTLGAGKMAGQTSPARPWFRYILTDKNVIGDALAMEWLSEVEKKMYETLARSNFYSRLHELWFQQGVFATAVIYIEEDDEDDIRCYVWPLGQYVLASSGKGRVDTAIREYDMTVEALVKEFGLDACTPRVQEMWRLGQKHTWVTVIHKIAPNVNRDTGKIDNANMPFMSLWIERDAGPEHDKVLRRSGYEEQPFFVARWDAVGEDVYGSGSPGMDALGDSKAIQKYELRKAEAVDKIVRPPMKAPVSAKTQRLSMLPGDVSYVDETAAGAKYTPAMEVRPESVTAAENTIAAHERRIAETFYVDLFLMMAQDERQQPVTAREISERHEEKMLMLGPVVIRDEDEVLDPIHNRVVNILGRRNKLPLVPESLRGQRIKVEYTSIMAQAQKLLATAATERFLSIVGSTSAINKNILDLPNFDKLLRNYGIALGLKPDEINAESVVKAMRERRVQEEQAAKAMEAQTVLAQNAKVASETDMTSDSMLTRLMQGAGAQTPVPYGRA